MDELKDLVIQSLETKGILGRIRAELRSTVFKIIDNPDEVTAEKSGLNAHNSKVQEISKNLDAQLAAEMIREFMEYYKMDYSLNVFVPESNLSREGRSKEELADDAGINEKQTEPLLLTMLKGFKSGQTGQRSDIQRDNFLASGDQEISRNSNEDDDDMFESNDSHGKKKNLPLLKDERLDKLAPLGTKENPIETTGTGVSKDKARLEEVEARLAAMDKQKDLFHPRSSGGGGGGNMATSSENDRYHIENDLEVDDDDIDEDLDHFEESDDFVPDFVQHKRDEGGVSMSQSIGIDGTVDSVALEDYDFIENVERPR